MRHGKSGARRCTKAQEGYVRQHVLPHQAFADVMRRCDAQMGCADVMHRCDA